MSGQSCPECRALLPAGAPACRKCGYDLILGRKPEGWLPPDARVRRRVALIGAVIGVSCVGIAAAISQLVPESPPSGGPPCQEAILALRPSIAAAFARGAPIPACRNAADEPPDCWAPLGVAAGELPDTRRARVRLRPSAGGFELECRTDDDGDGVDGVWKANHDVEIVRISPAGVR